MPIDPVRLAQDLIRHKSVTPEDDGALDVLADALHGLGFACHLMTFEDANTPPVRNLYARLGARGRNLCFAGHTDVVPPGDAASWRHGPFEAAIADGILYGRGAADMKSAIAAFAAAVSQTKTSLPDDASISFLITGDEEGVAINGTPKLLAWLKARGEKIDHCIVGEPTSDSRVGDTVKIGRRGSVNMQVSVRGTQGHVAYPHLAVNPLPVLAAIVTALDTHILDEGTPHFDPSTLSFTSIDVGNGTTNVIPAEGKASLNIRFNDLHTGDSLTRWVRHEAERIAVAADCATTLKASVSGEAFLTVPGAFTDVIVAGITQTTGHAPVFSTGGGTSDARFIKSVCPVAEIGLTNATMHKVDEGVPVADIETLTGIYQAIIAGYFAATP